MFEADAGEHLDLRRNHVGGVVAAAEAGLDHRHIDALACQLGVGGRGQQLELGHRIVAGAGAVDLLGGPQPAFDRVGHLLRRDVEVVDADALVEAEQMW